MNAAIHNKFVIFLIIMVFMVPLVLGCVSMRKGVLDLTREDLLNVETARECATTLLKTWPFYSGLIRGALGGRINDLPKNAVDAMDELDGLADKLGTDNLTDHELGYSIGLRVRMLGELIIAALKEYAPDVISLIPIAL